ncbi:MAG: hypothetical protein ACE5WD_07660 [Candidatus Aminicenantia bacterium]
MRKKLILIFAIVSLFSLFVEIIKAEEIMVPASAFNPYSQDNLYQRNFLRIYSDWGSPEEAFFAPVYLPQGKRVHKVIIYYYDLGSENIAVRLYRTNMYTYSANMMVQVTSKGDSGNGSNSSYSISTPVINNSGYGYSLKIYFPVGGGSIYRIYGVKIVLK